MVKVTCFGAAKSVTGSNFLVETSDGEKVLVDCGLFQGGSEMEGRNWEDWEYDPREIRTLILTHAHIDHSGRIPKIVKDGFSGKIITSPPTVDLCGVMLPDSAHVQEMEAEWRSRRNRRRDRRPIEPLYTTRDAEECLRLFSPMERDQVFDVEPGIRARLRNAGHILGSSILELWVRDGGQEIKIVFSGDVGRKDQLIVKDPHEIHDADFLFVESTYGNRFHRNFEDSKQELLEAIEYAVSHNEKVIIPAFALERTQEVLYVLGEFQRAGRLPDIPVYLDSPLAIKATEIFRKNREYYDENARAILEQGFEPFDMPNLRATPTTQESMEINKVPGSAIIISANGMCTAGRIKHHLKHNLWRPGASVIIMGFQAQGTTGRKIVEGADNVTIFGSKIAVRARVYTIGGFSAHADQGELLNWVGHFTEKSHPKVFLTHGEPTSSEALADAIRKRLNLDVYIPDWREVLQLDAKQGVKATSRRPAGTDLGEEARTVASDLEAEVDQLNEWLSEGKKISEQELEELTQLRDQLRAMMSR